ncbi:MAG: carbohydrate kinase family protein [Candidatus Hodarchaeales archaeon]
MSYDVSVIGGIGIDTNVFLYGHDIDFNIEANFSQNIDYIGQTAGYSCRIFNSLGKNTAFIGYVGKDFLGDYIKEQFARDGINSLFFTDPKGTKRSINMMNKNGTRKNFFNGKGSMESKPDLAACKKFFDTNLAHFGLANWTRYLLPLAKEADVTISCDLQDIPDVNDKYRMDFIDASDILFCSSVNIGDTTSLIKSLLKRNPTCIIVVGMGSKGCALGTKDNIKFFNPVKMNMPVIDTNGAGDGLAVGFLASYVLDGFPLQDSILRGQIVARQICNVKAKTEDLINRIELDDYYKMIKGQKGS